MSDWLNWAFSAVWVALSERSADFWSAIGQILSAATAIVTLPFILNEVRNSSNAQMADHILRYQSEVADLVDRLYVNRDDEVEWKSKFHDFVNFVEAYCGLINAKVFSGKAYELISGDIVSKIATIESSKYMKIELDRLVDTDMTFSEMTTFIEKNRTAIKKTVSMRAKRTGE